MRFLIVIIALFLLTAPLVFPQAPLPPEPETREEIVFLAEEPVMENVEEEPVKKVTPAPAPKPQTVVTSPPPEPAPLKTPTLATLLEEKIWLYTNTERSRRDLQTLEPNTVLAETARKHSADMLARDFFEHENPDGCSSSCRATNAGYSWRMIGENLYMLEGFEFSPDETAAMIVSGWMESPGHRANILKEGYTETGVGVVVQGNAIYATALYATPR